MPTQKVNSSEQLNDMSEGWIPVNQVWTYVSATSITVPTDATTTYQTGDKIRLKQSGAYKYFAVITVTSTLLVVYGGSDHSVANSAITDISFSRDVRPYGYPDIFSFTPSLNNVTVGNGTLLGKVSVQGRLVKGNVSLKWAAAASTSAVTGQIGLTPPITILASLSQYTTVGAAACVDFGVALYMGACVWQSSTGFIELRAINSAGTFAIWQATSSTVPLTWGDNDLFTMEFSYFI